MSAPVSSRRHTQRGAGAIEFIAVMGITIALLMGMMQLGLRSHAENIATSAAEAGLSSARAYDGTVAAGEAAVEERLVDLGDGLRATDVTVVRTATTVTVTVTGQSKALVPFIGTRVHVVVAGPVERRPAGLLS